MDIKLKNNLIKLFETALADFEGKNDSMQLDVTLPPDPFNVGSEHPITKISQLKIVWVKFQIISSLKKIT